MVFADLLQPILSRRDLTADQARELMQFLTGGEATEAQIGAALTGLRVKGCSRQELAAFAGVLRERAAYLQTPFPDLVDTCGTGGGIPSFNLSTAAAIVAASAGVRIAKHGNRAVTSSCGSADVLETLGVSISGDPEVLLKQLEATNIIFLFAPSHHPAMRYVAKARKELGFRTVFNQLGPLANPAGASRQLIGVYEPGLMRSMGEALNLLGTERAFLVHGLDGLDEISPCGPTEVVRVWEGRVTTETISPETFGLQPLPAAALAAGATKEEAATILERAVTDVESLPSQALIPNAAAAILLGGLESDPVQAAARAREAVRSGAARAKLEALRGSVVSA